MFCYDAELYAHVLCELAEGPVWDHRSNRLYWLDIKRGQVLTKDSEDNNPVVFEAAQNIGCMALREKGGMIMGMTAGIYLTDGQGDYQSLTVPGHSPRVRFNDGKCDPLGRFWAGSINLFPGEANSAALYCVLPDLRIKKMLDGVTNSNGLVFTPDTRSLYYIDTPTRRVDAFEVCEDSEGFPELKNRRIAFSVPEELGYPDGMTMDNEGRLWIACWGSGRVCCFDPKDGSLLGWVQAPVMAVSSCCFGGADMQTLFITTAREGLLPGEENIAGDIFHVRLDISGARSHRFMG